MIVANHDAKEGKLKTFFIGVGGIVLGGVLTAVLVTLAKKPLQKLEAAVS